MPCRLGASPPTTPALKGDVGKRKRKGGEKVPNYSTSFLCRKFFHGDSRQPVFPKWNEREEAGKEPTLDGIPSPHRYSRNKLLNFLGLHSLPCSTGGSTVMGLLLTACSQAAGYCYGTSPTDAFSTSAKLLNPAGP